jgi:hypothetical protein
MPIELDEAIKKMAKEKGFEYKKEYVLSVLCKELGFKYINQKELVEKI